MKRALLPTLLLLLAGCASSTAVVDKRSFRCGPGQDIEMRAGLDDGTIGHKEIAGELRYLVEVANNSHGDITVANIRIDARPRFGEKRETVEPIARTFDQLIPENGEHVFELPATSSGPWVLRRPDGPQELELAVIVSLSNGDSYHCSFLVKPRE